MRRRLALAAATTVALLAPAGPAPAAPGMESQLQDDPLLVYGTAQQVDATLETARRLGVDRIRVTLQWRLVAPAAESSRRPRGFVATDPAAYPRGAWDRFDRIVFLARQKGLKVNMNVTGPGPRWAMRRVKRRDLRNHYAPSAREFARFVAAAGRRYGPAGPSPETLTVDFWSVWNEPNQGGWLAPQWQRASDRRSVWVESSPRRYRALANAAWRALAATGHGADTFLLGELAPSGRSDRGRTRPIRPRRFVRALFCVDARRRPLRGRSARRRGCPDDAAGRRRFVERNPGLFRATGFAHHPYALTTSPTRRSRARDDVRLADLRRLRVDLRTIMARWGVPRELPLYLTEYGYETRPDPIRGISLARQAAWLNEAGYLAYAAPDVRMTSQFLLRDDAPVAGARTRRLRWRTFQSGLLLRDGTAKPSYYAYRVPVHVPDPVGPAAQPFRVWGQVRPPTDGEPVRVDVQWRPRGAGDDAWRAVASAGAGPKGFVDLRTPLPAGAGQVRLVHVRPDGQVLASRVVNVRAT